MPLVFYALGLNTGVIAYHALGSLGATVVALTVAVIGYVANLWESDAKRHARQGSPEPPPHD